MEQHARRGHHRAAARKICTWPAAASSLRAWHALVSPAHPPSCGELSCLGGASVCTVQPTHVGPVNLVQPEVGGSLCAQQRGGHAGRQGPLVLKRLGQVISLPRQRLTACGSMATTGRGHGAPPFLCFPCWKTDEQHLCQFISTSSRPRTRETSRYHWRHARQQRIHCTEDVAAFHQRRPGQRSVDETSADGPLRGEMCKRERVAGSM